MQKCIAAEKALGKENINIDSRKRLSSLPDLTRIVLKTKQYFPKENVLYWSDGMSSQYTSFYSYHYKGWDKRVSAQKIQYAS